MPNPNQPDQVEAPAADAGYPIGSLKISPDGKAVAIRNSHATVATWSVMTVDQGGYHATYSSVEDWQDLPPHG